MQLTYETPGITSGDIMRKVINGRVCKALLILLVFSSVTACIQAKSVRYEKTERLSKPENYPIEILEPRDIKRPYKVIGFVQIEAGKLHDTAKVVERLRGEARKMGGDALMELQQQPIGVGIPQQGGGTFYSGHVRDLWTAKVIVWE